MLHATSGIILCALVMTAAQVLAEERYALVIGNGAYENIDPLTNPPNDVRLVSETLKAVGFEVTLLVDANKRQMDNAARKFARALDEAGRNTVGVFYFAGHGVSYEGENWLIPVGADIREGVDIEYETVSANKILKLMEGARNATDILILDACRNSPFRGFSLSGTRAIRAGMSRMDAPAGSFIAYSTAPGAVAYDGSGDYSPFAAAFAAEIKTPGLSIGDMMIEVRKRVKTSTERIGGTPQTPWDASSLTGRFLFNPGAAALQNAGSAQPVPQPQQLDVTLQRQTLRGAEERYWVTVKDSQDPAEYEAYLKKYPAGEFADIAKARRDRYALPAIHPGLAGAQFATNSTSSIGGVDVTEVETGSAAAQHGLRLGDTISEVNRRTVGDLREFRAVAHGNRILFLLVRRGDRQLMLQIR